jgi:hypothetical protein
VKYRELLFNKANPDFGFFIMPFIFFSNVLTIVLLFRTMFFLVNDIYSWLVVTLSYLALGGSFFFAINEIILPPSVFFFTTSYVLVCVYFALAFFSAKQYPSLKDLPVVAMLILIYPFFISFIYTRSYFREMFGVRAKWLRVST